MMGKQEKILVILGPTASGKSDLAVELAKQFNGEVISADSRQVYKGLDIGSGKITTKEMKGVSHYLLDVVQPQTVFTVAKFQRLARKKIKDILARGKLPIICGGTGFYIQSIVDRVIFPKIKPNLTLRKHLEILSPSELFLMLKKLDTERAEVIDPKNPRRLIRAIEIATHFGKVQKLSPLSTPTTQFKTLQIGVKIDRDIQKLSTPTTQFQTLQIGIKTDRDVLKGRIAKRFVVRVKQGIIAEAQKLHEQGLSYKRFSEIGLAHKYMALYLRNKISKESFIEESVKAEQKYAKRQMTWFKRDKRIKWFDLEERSKVKSTVSSFLKK